MKKTLQGLYENMGSPKEEEIVKESSKFSKFDLSDYTDLLYEGKSGHGDEKIVVNALKDAVKDGSITVKETKNGWLVKSVKDPTMMEAIHKGERAFHYLRRFLQKI